MIFEFKDVDKLSPNDFEYFVRDVFVAAGWTDAVITEVGKEFRHGDGGVDIFATKNKRKFAIEVKQRSLDNSVDVSALNQLVTGAKLANVINMILVTNSYFTSEVKIRALRLGIELIDRDELQNLWVKKQSEIGRDIKPRKYQESVISNCIEQYLSGKTRFLIEMATGLGKTYTVAHIVKRILLSSENRIKVLFLAHQIEILLQSVTAFKNVLGIGSYSFSACFDGSDPEDTEFVFASFDTLYSKINLLERNTFDVIIVDEAHHTPAKTYSEVVRHFHPKLLLGLTATPDRSDNLDVLGYFGGAEGHIGRYDLAWALKHNKLAFPKYMVMLDDIDQTRLDQLGSGLTVSDLDKKLFLHKKDAEVVKIIEKTIQEKNIENVKGIVFCNSIIQMKHLIQFFDLGKATLVHSKMTDQERRNNIRNFRDGDFRYILVCDLFNEGIDIPETNLLVFMRYTASRTIWLQQLGRGLRKTPNKEYVHVLDFVGSLDRLNEVQKLAHAINNVKIERENCDRPPRDMEDQEFHDATLNVNYNQSAAQVLKLIEELKYRLNSREMLIDSMRNYAERSNRIPQLNEIEELLPNISCDQVSTHFDSYYRYLQAAVPFILDKLACAQRLNNYIYEYTNKNNVNPSVKAISLAFKHNSLIEFAELDVIELVGKINSLRCEVLPCNSFKNETFSDKTNDLHEHQAAIDHQARIIKKHLGSVETVQDMKSLSEEDRAEIKAHFRSDFYFLKIIIDSAET
ncbi:MAG: DEAD/DEAH box helicase family protein [Sulfuricellaceae bacterium]|nr:DEAD/DEAH box helicase family protein [Sulfuricellaceae bacterium]